LVGHILHDGLRSSIHSHNVIGTWVNTNIESALNWTSSVFDLTPSLALEIVAPKLRTRQNKDIKQGSDERMLVELHKNSTLPSIHIAAVIVTIPSMERCNFRGRLISTIFSTSQMFWNIQDGQQCFVQDVFSLNEMLRDLCSFRYVYIGTPGALDEDFGGTNDILPECLIKSSLHFTAALYYVIELTSISNQRQRLKAVKASMLPPPMYDFMCQEAPAIQDFWDATDSPCKDRPEWRSMKEIQVKRWGAVKSHQEAMASKMYI
jgi:hypothetical protein